MDEETSRLWMLRFRKGNVQEGAVRARNGEMAERVGRKFCELQGAMFMIVRPFELADESILGESVPAVQPDDEFEKTSLQEQRVRQRERNQSGRVSA